MRERNCEPTDYLLDTENIRYALGGNEDERLPRRCDSSLPCMEPMCNSRCSTGYCSRHFPILHKTRTCKSFSTSVNRLMLLHETLDDFVEKNKTAILLCDFLVLNTPHCKCTECETVRNKVMSEFSTYTFFFGDEFEDRYACFENPEEEYPPNVAPFGDPNDYEFEDREYLSDNPRYIVIDNIRYWIDEAHSSSRIPVRMHSLCLDPKCYKRVMSFFCEDHFPRFDMNSDQILKRFEEINALAVEAGPSKLRNTIIKSFILLLQYCIFHGRARELNVWSIRFSAWLKNHEQQPQQQQHHIFELSSKYAETLNYGRWCGLRTSSVIKREAENRSICINNRYYWLDTQHTNSRKPIITPDNMNLGAGGRMINVPCAHHSCNEQTLMYYCPEHYPVICNWQADDHPFCKNTIKFEEMADNDTIPKTQQIKALLLLFDSFMANIDWLRKDDDYMEILQIIVHKYKEYSKLPTFEQFRKRYLCFVDPAAPRHKVWPLRK